MIARRDRVSGWDPQKRKSSEFTLMFACLSGSFFVVTLISSNEHSVKEVNQPKRDWDKFTMAVRDEAGRAIVEPILYRRFRRGRSFIGFNTRRAKDGEIRET